MRVSHSILLAAGLLAGVAHAEPAPSARGLDSNQLQAIRAVGRSVLAAKKAQASDPALTELRQTADELRALAKESMGSVSATPNAPLLERLPPLQSPQEAADQKDEVPSARVKSMARSRLAQIELRRGRAMDRARARQADQADGPNQQMASAASDRLEALARDLDTALAATSEDGLQKINQIRQRLEPKRMRDIQLENQAPGLQPTVSTRLTHAMPIPAVAQSQPADAVDVSGRPNVVKPSTQGNKTREPS